MELSPHNIQRITKWIQSEVDYNFLNPCYTYAFQDDQVLLEQNDKELKQVCPHCLLVPRYPLFFLNADTSHVFHVSKNIGNINLCLKQFFLVQFASNLVV